MDMDMDMDMDMGNISQFLKQHQRATDHYYFKCPGCKSYHAIRLDGTSAGWQIVSRDPLSISPSVKVSTNTGPNTPEIVLYHLYITNDKIDFLEDCRHELAGKRVPLELPTIDLSEPED